MTKEEILFSLEQLQFFCERALETQGFQNHELVFYLREFSKAVKEMAWGFLSTTQRKETNETRNKI